MGEHIKKRRLELKLLQIELAALLGVDEMTIVNWEKNWTNPMLHLLPKVIEFLCYNPLASEPETLGEKLLQYRKRKGLSQRQLAKKIGIDPGTLGRLERTVEKCSPAILRKATTFLLGSVTKGGGVVGNHSEERKA